MQISYDPTTEHLHIEDKTLRTQQILRWTLGLLFLANGARVFDSLDQVWGAMEYFHLAVCLLCLVAVLTDVFRNSYATSIPVREVEKLRIRRVLGNPRYDLRLQNGKVRMLQVASDREREALLRMAREAGLPVAGSVTA